MFLLKTNLVGQPTGQNGFLTPDECRRVIEMGESSLQLGAGLTEDRDVHEDIRKSEISWFGPAAEHEWLFSRLRECVNSVNTHWFGYNLIGVEGIQFTKYSYRKGQAPDFYSSHRDTLSLKGGTVRKLSFTVQLSDPETYDGGEVILYNTLTDSITLSKSIGSISFFPSYTIHEVVPVTRGVRHSLVGWGFGPAFV